MTRSTFLLVVVFLAVQACATARAQTPIPNSLGGQILLRADEIEYDTDKNIVSAVGHVEVDDSGKVLLADRLDYDQKNDVVTASGHVSLLDEKGDVAFADHVILSDQMRDGTLSSFSALIGKSGRLAAADARRVVGRYTVAHDIMYSSCKICAQPGQRTPLWRVHADRVVYDQEAHRLYFHDATIDFFGVPLLYTPYLSEPDPSVRHATGILRPTLGHSTSIGYFASVPVYIALSDSNDATISPLISTGGGELLEGEYRQRWDDGGTWLQASVANNPYGGFSRKQNQTYAHAFGSLRYPLDPTWRVGADVQYSSNDTYLKLYDISWLDRLTNDLFIDGESGRSRFALTGYFFEGLRPTDHSDQFPWIMPLFQYSLIPQDKVLGGQFRFDVNSAIVNRTTGPNSQRVTGELNWRLPFVVAAGQLFTFIADARGDVYHVDNTDSFDFFPSDLAGVAVPVENRFISRGSPYVALDWRWPFVNDLGRSSALIVEPIAQLIAQPYGANPRGIPDEDSAAFETDDNDIFSFDRVPGYDLLESGPRFNAGFRAEALWSSGSIETEWGQTYRFKPDPIFASDTGEAGTVSDIVGRVSVKFLPYIDITDRIDLDRADGSVRQHEVYITATYDRSSLQVSYTQLPAELVTLGLGSREEINAQADINFWGNWQAFGAVRRDLILNQMLNAEFGLGYEDECLGISVAYKRTYTTVESLLPSTAIVLRFNLKSGEQPIGPFSLFPRDTFNHP
jgi:LPS-assembly protein